MLRGSVVLAALLPLVTYAQDRWPLYADAGLIVNTPGRWGIDLAAASAPDGGILVMWREQDVSAPPYEFRVQRFDSSGNPLWASGTTVFTTSANANSQAFFAVLSDPQGGGWAAWSNMGYPEEGHAQRLDPSGVPLWVDGGVQIASEESWWNRLVPNPQGGAWLMNRTGNTIDVAVTALGDTQPGASPFHLAGINAYGQYRYQVATFSNGRVLVAGTNTYASSAIFRAQALDAAGQKSYGATGVQIGGNAISMDMVQSADDQPLIVWEEPAGQLRQVHVQKMDGTAGPLWAGDGGVVVGDDNGAAGSGSIQPSAVTDGAGGAVITWLAKVGTQNVVLAQRVSSTGQLMWPAPGIIVGNTYLYGWGRVTRDNDGKYVAVFPEAAAVQRAQRFDDTGAMLWPDGGVRYALFQVVQSTTGNAEDNVWLVPSNDGVIVAEYHAYDVMLHRLRYDGTLGGTVSPPDSGTPDAGPGDAGTPDGGTGGGAGGGGGSATGGGAGGGGGGSAVGGGSATGGGAGGGGGGSAAGGGSATGGGSSAGGGSATGGGGMKPPDDGCACSAGSGDPLLVFGALVLLARRRKLKLSEPR